MIAQESLPVHKRSATSLVATAKSYIHPLHLFRLISFCVWLQEPDLLLTSLDSPQSKALRKKNTPTCVRWDRLPKRIIQDLSQVGLAYFIYLFFYSGMEFTLTFLTHIRWHFYLFQSFYKLILGLGLHPCSKARCSSSSVSWWLCFRGVLFEDCHLEVNRRYATCEGHIFSIYVFSFQYAMMGLLLIVPSFAIVGSAYSLPTL